jgi:hypothetical protein
MANAFTKAQFMEPPSSGVGAVPIGAVKAGAGIQISADGIISLDGGSGIINDIVCTNGIQGGGSSPQVFIGLLPPTNTTIGGVKTVPGSNISIDSEGVIRSTSSFALSAGTGITLTNTTPESATVNLAQAGVTINQLGGVFAPTGGGLNVASDGGLTVAPATVTTIGGIKPGTGCSVTADGTLNATGAGGTITGVGTGTGLGGGGTTGAVTVFLRPAGYGADTNIGGVYAGENITIDPDGKINVEDAALGVLTVTGTDPIVIEGTPTNPVVTVQAASTSQAGVVQLSNDPNSLSQNTVPTSLALNTVFVEQQLFLLKSGGTMTGNITFAANQTFPGLIPSSSFTQKGQLLVGTGSGTFINISAGAPGQVLSTDMTSGISGLKWITAGTGTVTSVSGTTPVQVADGSTTPVISVDAASTTSSGIVQLYDGTDSTSTTLAATANAVKTAYDFAGTALSRSGGTMTGDITFNAGQAFPGVLPLSGGTMTGLVTFDPTQLFPNTVQSIGAIDATINIGGTPENPLIDVATATTSALGVVQPDGTTITVDANGVISAAAATGFLALTGGTMTGDITFAGTQTFPGVLAEGALSADLPLVVGGTLSDPVIGINPATTVSLGAVQPDGTTITVDANGVISAAGSTGSISETIFTGAGGLITSSAADTPVELAPGANNTILAVNAGLPAWRTSLQLGLLTTSAAASTYAPIDNPTFTGPVVVNAGGSAGANALVVSGGNLVLSTSFTPTSSSSTGSQGELAWDSDYLYFCYAPNTWGRVAVDLTPF